MNTFAQVGNYLVQLVFSLITLMLWLRIAIRFFKINPFNSVAQTIFSLTNPVITPLEQVLVKNNASHKGRLDWVAFLVLAFTVLAKFLLIDVLLYNASIPGLGILLLTVAELIVQPCDLLFLAILIRAVISWVNPSWNNPVAAFLYAITEPLMSKCRSYLPDTSGLDFSPLVAMVLLKILTIIVHSLVPLNI